MRRVLIFSVAGSAFILYILYVQFVTSTMPVHSMKFEVFGKVQGVFFRKYTKAQADKLGIRGWCMNAPQGSVIGYIEGTPEAIPIMMKWLELQGSPSSEIERVIFTGQKVKLEYDFTSFEIRPS